MGSNYHISRQFDADAQCKDEQPFPYFGRQGHQEAAHYHQGYRHYTPGAPVFQHAGVSRIPDGPLLIAQEILGERIGARLFDQRFDLRQQGFALIVFQRAVAYQPGT